VITTTPAAMWKSKSATFRHLWFLLHVTLAVLCNLSPAAAFGAQVDVSNMRPLPRDSFVLMPYPIFTDTTGKKLHLVGRDKIDLSEVEDFRPSPRQSQGWWGFKK